MHFRGRYSFNNCLKNTFNICSKFSRNLNTFISWNIKHFFNLFFNSFRISTLQIYLIYNRDY